MRHFLRGLDEMAVETAFIGVSALVFLVVLARALNTDAARQAEGIPLVGAAVAGVRELVGQVVTD